MSEGTERTSIYGVPESELRERAEARVRIMCPELPQKHAASVVEMLVQTDLDWAEPGTELIRSYSRVFYNTAVVGVLMWALGGGVTMLEVLARRVPPAAAPVVACIGVLLIGLAPLVAEAYRPEPGRGVLCKRRFGTLSFIWLAGATFGFLTTLCVALGFRS